MTEIDRERKLLTIAILGGTGKEGPGLAMRWVSAGYPIIIGSRSEEKARLTAEEIRENLGVENITGMVNNKAAQESDISVLTVVATAHQSAVEGLRADLKGKILVDATARVDFRDPRPPEPPAAARIAQDILGEEVKVVAAFQNVPAHSLRKNLDETLNTDVLVCADDQESAVKVIELAKNGGMRAYYAGNLDNSIIVEGMTSLLIGINKFYGVKTASINVSGLDL